MFPELSEFIFLLQLFYYPTESQDIHCFHADKALRRPSIIISSKGQQDFLPAYSVENVTGTQLGIILICQHTTPIRWNTDLNMTANPFNARKSFSRRLKNPLQTPNATYVNYFEFLYSRRFKNPVVISCEPVLIKDPNERIHVVITPGVACAQASCSPDLPQQYPELRQGQLSLPSPEKGMDSKDCKIELFLITTPEDGLHYKWKRIINANSSQPLIKQHLVTNEIVIFESYFRRANPIPTHCVIELRPEEMEEGFDKVYQDVINGIVMYAKDERDEWVFRGVFNLSSEIKGPRRIFPFENIKLDEMIHLETPLVFYVNKSEIINCSVSILPFAFGSILTSGSDDSKTTQPYNVFNETYREDGKRVVSRKFTFSTGNELRNISCIAPLQTSSTNFIQTRQFLVEYPELPSINGSLEKEVITVVQGETRVIICKANGNPLPTLSWKLPNSNKEFRKSLMVENSMVEKIAISRLNFPTFESEYVGTYICEAANYLGMSLKHFDIQLPPGGLSQSGKVGLGSGLGIFILLFFGVVIFIHYKIVIQRKIYRAKKYEAIQEFKEGIKKLKDKQKETQDKIMMNHDLYVFEQPYDDQFEVSEDLWSIENTILGQGNFGMVRSGEVEVKDRKVPVAIKTLKSSVDIDDFKSFLFELKVMVYMGKNTNIVSLVAACTKNIHECDVMIGVEFCTNGSLYGYLTTNRNLFQPRSFELLPGSSQGTYANLINSMSLTEKDLYVWAYQIASGMEYLSAKKVLHGDLATRNVLLTSDKTAKISDFGLSRVLLESSNYTKKTQTPLPWKWMPVESLKRLQFSQASDAWAFGVTLWEIFSLGESPYAGLHFSPDFTKELERGMRLEKPSKASNYAYEIMKYCWHEDPRKRLGFSDLKNRFSRILKVFSDNSSFDLECLPFLDHTPIPQRRGLNTPQQETQFGVKINTAVSNTYLNC